MLALIIVAWQRRRAHRRGAQISSRGGARSGGARRSSIFISLAAAGIGAYRRGIKARRHLAARPHRGVSRRGASGGGSIAASWLLGAYRRHQRKHRGINHRGMAGSRK